MQSEEEQLEQEYIRTRLENGESHASGARPELGPVVLGNPTTAVVVIRVGLYASGTTSSGFSEFYSLNHPSIDLTNTDGDVKVIDRSTGKEITVMTAGSLIHVLYDGTGYLVTQDGLLLGSFDGPVFFRPESAANLFRVESMKRTFSGTKVPLYRGAMEIARGSATAPQRMNLVNVVPIEDYVPGVVANESIASFAAEALKAQAVAARGYAIANVGNYERRGYPFDIVDSSSSQVYRGVISEHPNAVAAAAGTYGLVATADGRIIGALYSSSFGGHSESNEWISYTANQASGGAPTSYLRGVYDGVEPGPDLTTDAGINAFWRTQPPVPLIYDDCSFTGNGFSRWKLTLTPSTIKTRLTNTNTTQISGFRTGTLRDVVITQRMGASARALVARFTFAAPDGVAEVRGWESLRKVLGTTQVSGGPRACGSSTIASNFVLNAPSALDVAKDINGNVTSVTVYGGGWGHNQGMSQYGAHGRGKLGQAFIDILKAYYTGIDVGSYPIDVGREPGSGPPTLRQEFVAPNGLAAVEIRAQDLKALRVHVNDTLDLSFDETQLASGFVSADISAALVAGINVIQYNPVGRWGSATVSVVVR